MTLKNEAVYAYVFVLKSNLSSRQYGSTSSIKQLSPTMIPCMFRTSHLCNAPTTPTQLACRSLVVSTKDDTETTHDHLGEVSNNKHSVKQTHRKRGAYDGMTFSMKWEQSYPV